MEPQTLESRVESLEQRVTLLEQLPARVDALTLQVSQLRDEMHAEFSAVHGDIRAGDEAVIRSLREEIRAGDEAVIRTLREEIRTGDEETRRVLREEMGSLEVRLRDDMRVLSATITAGHQEIMAQARTLYEDMHRKSAILEEGRRARRKPRSTE